jgi:hypothetical protein
MLSWSREVVASMETILLLSFQRNAVRRELPARDRNLLRRSNRHAKAGSGEAEGRAMTKIATLLKDLWRNIRTLCRMAIKGNWKFVRFIIRSTFCGLVTLHCKKCGHPCWYTASKNCGSCQIRNLMDAIYNPDPDEVVLPCVACGGESDGVCENCDACLCYDCDSCKYHDVLTCKDEAACDERCKAISAELSAKVRKALDEVK